MATNEPQDALAEFRPTDEEFLILALTKLWLMQTDYERDPDPPDREVKHVVCLEYAVELHRAFQQQLEFEDVPDATVRGFVNRMESEGWAPAIRRALGDVGFDEARKLMSDRRVIDSLLSTVTRRDRAVLLLVELSAFFPWTNKVKFEKDVRRHALDDVATGFSAGITVEYAREIDHEIARRARNLALKNLNYKKIGLIAGGGAVIGVITGGLAAPFIGTAIGGAMGLSGIAATNAGLALLGGGSLASGGFGIAGGTLMIAGVAGVGGGAAFAGGGALNDHQASYTFADMVKLDVLTEYMLIRERSEPEIARLVVLATEESVRNGEAECERLDARVDVLGAQVERLLLQLDGTKLRADTAEAKLAEKSTELEAVTAERDELEQALKYQRGGLKTIERHVEGYRLALEP